LSTKLHLGCGKNLLPGWRNIDIVEGPGVILQDLTREFQIRSGEVDFVFSEHFIEHITLEQAGFFFSECYRVLRKGGVLRVSTPDLCFLIKKYLEERLSEWKNVGWNPSTPCRMINEGMRLWGHQFLYDNQELETLLHEAKFSEVYSVEWRKSRHVELCNLECRPYHGELIFEAAKG
jgi:predicted SAM-dependent methyltransferase